MNLFNKQNEQDWIKNEMKRIETHISKNQLKPEELKTELNIYQTLDGIRNRIDVNELIKIGGGIFMLWMILRFERADTITSKGFGILTKFIGR